MSRWVRQAEVIADRQTAMCSIDRTSTAAGLVRLSCQVFQNFQFNVLLVFVFVVVVRSEVWDHRAVYEWTTYPHATRDQLQQSIQAYLSSHPRSSPAPVRPFVPLASPSPTAHHQISAGVAMTSFHARFLDHMAINPIRMSMRKVYFLFGKIATLRIVVFPVVHWASP